MVGSLVPVGGGELAERKAGSLTLVYLSIPEERMAGLLLAPADVARERSWRVLERMGIAGVDGETPIQAWTRAMCELNGLDYRPPIGGFFAECVARDPELLRFLWVIA
jgi:hypothetical protein